MADLGKFEALAVAVACGSDIRTAAKKLGLAESSAYHTTCGHEFKNRVAALRTEATQAAVGRLASAAVQAVDTLTSMLDADFEPSIRLSAAKAILASLAPVSEFAELRARVDALAADRVRVVA